jgi:hypothetical protein
MFVSLAFAVVVHAVLLAALLHWTRVRPSPPRERAELEVRLIGSPLITRPGATPQPAPTSTPPHVPEASPRRSPSQAPDIARTIAPAVTPSSPPSDVPRAAPRVEVETRSIVAPSPDVASTPTTADTPTLRLFHRDGSIDLPDGDTEAGDPAAFGSRKRVAPYSPDPMVHRSPLPYEPTMFERVWAPRDESLLGEWVRNATRSKSWDTQGGTRISCSAFLFFGGCGWGPTPRVSIEELKRMRADPPMPRPAPLLPEPADDP